MLADTEKRSLRRSRRLSNFTREDRNPIHEDETSTAAAVAVAARNPISKKRGRTAKTQVTTNIGATSTAAAKQQNPSQVREAKGTTKNDESSEIDRKPEASKNATKTKKRSNRDNFDIESVLLEPKPRRKRLKSTTTTNKKKKKSKSEEVKRNLEPQDPQTSEVVASFLPDSGIRLNSTNRCLDLLGTSEDDHRLIRKLEGPFDASKFTTGIATYDKANEGDVDEVPAYVTDIFQRLFDAEVRCAQ